MSSESDTERDGAFSYSSEWHAFAIGAGVGFAAVLPSRRLRTFVFQLVGIDNGMTRTDAYREARKESWYALGGVMLGATLALACLLTAVIGGIALM